MSSGLVGAFAAETALVTFRSVQAGGVKTGPSGNSPLPAPLPSLYTSVLLVYGALAILPSSLAPVPALIGWGFVVATFLNLYQPGAANAAAASNATLATNIATPPK